MDLGGDALVVLVGQEDLQDVAPLMHAGDVDSHGSLGSFEGVNAVDVDVNLPVCWGAVRDAVIDGGAII